MTERPDLALKIDVDTHQGLGEGVPRMLDVLRRRGLRASFYVAMGPDNSGKAIRRLFTQRGFAKKMFRSNAVRLYGLRTAMLGTLLPAPAIARSFPDVLRRIVAEGHELGVHGNDHVDWHDHAVGWTVAAAERALTPAIATFEEILGRTPTSFAAPGWQCGETTLAVLERGPFTYHSSTRGTHPYRPRIGATEGKLAEIPTTLPTADELLGEGVDGERLLDALLGEIGTRPLEVLTLHAEVEGGPYLPFFERLLESLAERTRIRRLDEIADEIDPAALPLCSVAQGTRPGRGGTVSCQIP